MSNNKVYNLDKSKFPFEFNSDFNVYYYHDMILYRYFYHFDSSGNGELLLSQKRVSYFVHQKDSVFGQYYNSHPQSIIGDNERMHIDSIHKKRIGKEYDSLASWKPDSSYWSSDGKIFNKIYDRAEEKPSFIYHLAYTGDLKNIDQSYSRRLDSLRNMKLYKVVLDTQEGHSEKYKQIIPRFEIYNEMKEVPVTNKEEVMGYFLKYEKECLKR